ncbi:hypothetical protein BD769DRAFT_1778182 [Suillus cothurnatus]|nr:hypothetical protein BD769DRAFT_1778182 [Suillus cothurnatus]
MDLALLLYAALTLGRQTPLQTRPNTAAASPAPPRVPTPCAPLKRPVASSSPTILLLDAFLQFPLLPLPPLRFHRHGYLLHFLLAPLPLADNYYDSQYPSFLQFSLDPDILEKTGDEVATLGEQLESVFGWKARTSGDGVIPILERGKFEQSILQYITIVAPIIRALWSLEAAYANASDVFIFWLAIIATLNDLFSKGPNMTGVPVSLACEVTAIINKWYHEFFTNEVYFVAFTLDPRYPNSDFLKKPTANATTIVIPVLSQRTGQRTPLPYPHAYTRVKDFLKEKLQKDLSHYVANPDSYSAAEVASGLRHQLEAFWHGEWPFNQQVKDGNPLAWWESLQDHLHARVLAHLAIKIFSVLVNSMPEERTNSTITWFNSPTRGSQNAQTLVDMIQIGQWYGKHQNKDYVLSKYCPVVKFRNIEESVLQAVQTGSTDDESVADIDRVADSDNEDEAEDKLLESEIDEHQPAQAVAFEIHPDIDINSKALKDMVSTDPVSVVSTVGLSSMLESPQAAMMVTDDGDADWNC